MEDEFGLDFLKNDDSTYKREYFDDPISNLDVTYSDLTQMQQTSKNIGLSVNDN